MLDFLRRPILRAIQVHFWGMDIHPSAKIAPSALIDRTWPKGVHIAAGCVIDEEAVVLAHDMTRGLYLDTRIGERTYLGARSIVMPGITIAADCVVAPGAVVTRDVPPNAIVVGNPARIVGYIDAPPSATHSISLSRDEPLRGLRASGAYLKRMPLVADLRGALTFGEIERHLPFTPKRFFVVYDVPSQEVRGEHAHKALHEFLICLRGSCAIMVDDGTNRDEVVLNDPTVGLHIPPQLWRVHYKYTPDAMVLVLASDIYKASDYIRDYEEFLAYVREVSHVAV
mgnify:CR=1 FL=1